MNRPQSELGGHPPEDISAEALIVPPQDQVTEIDVGEHSRQRLLAAPPEGKRRSGHAYRAFVLLAREFGKSIVNEGGNQIGRTFSLPTWTVKCCSASTSNWGARFSLHRRMRSGSLLVVRPGRATSLMSANTLYFRPQPSEIPFSLAIAANESSSIRASSIAR